MDGIDLAVFRREVDRIIKERSWSLRRLATEAHLNPGTVSKFLRGVGPEPAASTVLAIALAVGLELNDQRATAPPASASTPSREDLAFQRGYEAGWQGGWDAAVRTLHGGASGPTPSPPS